jgi:hypothetical protein
LKKFLALFSSFLLVFNICTYKVKAVNTHFDSASGLTYSDDGAITSYKMPSNKTINDKLIIPYEINNIKITSIAPYAFYKSNDINKIEIQSQLDKIGDYAFAYSSIHSIDLVGSGFLIKAYIKNIGNYSFEGSQLNDYTFMTIGETETIGDGAFKDIKSLYNFEGDINLKSIGNYAFYNTTLLCYESDIYPLLKQNLKTIGSYAFANCNLNAPTKISSTITNIGENAFQNEQSGFKMKVINNSYVMNYAKSNNIPYEICDAPFNSYISQDPNFYNLPISITMGEIGSKYGEGNFAYSYGKYTNSKDFWNSNYTITPYCSFWANKWGYYTICTEDTMGEWGSPAYRDFEPETYPPQIQLISQTPTTTTNGQVNIEIKANDDESGIDYILMPDGTKYNTIQNGDYEYGVNTNYIDVTYSASKNGSYIFTAYDKVGNHSSLTVNVNNIIKTISITHPITINYNINPNNDIEIQSPDLQIDNNSNSSINVQLNNIQNDPNSDLNPNYVLPNAYSNWNLLTLAQSKSNIALGIKVKDSNQLSTIWDSFNSNIIYKPQLTSPISLGILKARNSGILQVTGQCGRSFDKTYNLKTQLIFNFTS